MKKLILGLFVLGFAIQSFAQVTTVQLPEVEIVAVNYKYLYDVNNLTADSDVKMLEKKVATFDLKSSEFYNDEYDNYTVTFYIPDGTILASYDKEGTIIRTAEKFKNIDLPEVVLNTVLQQFPGWLIAKDAYLVTYHKDAGGKKMYKLLLEKGKKRKRIKTDEYGNLK